MLTVKNPLLPQGEYSADPELHKFGDTYWVYYTRKDTNGLDAYCSKDMLNWTKVPDIVDMRTFPYAKNAFWAPAVTEYKGKYYIAFTCNCLFQNDPPKSGGMSFGVSDNPGGPFVNVREDNCPMIDFYVHGAQPIDGQFFLDDDGTHYFYFGTGEHCVVGILNENIDGFVPFDGGENMSDDHLFKEITPTYTHKRNQFYEGTFVIKRNGMYYLMYSVDGWDTHRYSVCYATSDNPLGPFVYKKKILETDPTFANGPGHHSCLYLEDYDQWVICYHRRNMGDHYEARMACVDKMDFDENGEIKDVFMTSVWSTDGSTTPTPPDLSLNLALKDGATYFASTYEDYFPPKNAFDGKIGFDSRWAIAYEADGEQYLGVNFGKETTFNRIVLDFQYMGDFNGINGEYELQISKDGNLWETLTPLRSFSKEESEFKFDLSIITEKFDTPVTAQAVRVYFPTSRMWLSIYEFEVYND